MRVVALAVRRLAAGACTRPRGGGPWRRAALAQQFTHYSTQLFHPTAVIGDGATIAEGVKIGPFCVVSDGAVIGADCELGPGAHVLGNTTLGDRCVIRSHAVVGAEVRACHISHKMRSLSNRTIIFDCFCYFFFSTSDTSLLLRQVPGTTVLGRGNIVGSHAVVGSQCQDKKYAAGDACHLRVGDGNDIREHAQVHRSSSPHGCTTVGDDNLIMGSCHIGHDCTVGDGNTLSNHSLLVSARNRYHARRTAVQ